MKPAADRVTYLFDGYTLDLGRGTLARGPQPLKLRPKSFQTLQYLVENRGRLVGKDELMGAVWGEVAVTDDSLVQCLIEIRRVLGGELDQYIKTVPRRGYIFDAQVSIGEIPAPLTSPPMPPTSKPGGIRRLGLPAALVAAAIAIGLLAYAMYRGPDGGKVRTIAVLPFKEIGTGPESDALGLGMTDALITKLSNVRKIIVRPTSAVRRYNSENQDPAAAGREQQVEAVLDGNFQRSGDRIRLSVQLVDVKDGRPLWAGTFDEQMGELFTVQDRVSQRVAEALNVRLTGEETKLLTKRSTRDAEADLLLHEGNTYRHEPSRASVAKSIEYYEAAIRKDPDLAPAYSGLASVYAGDISPLGPAESAEKVEALLQKALQLDSDDAEAHAVKGVMSVKADNFSEGEKELRHAIEMDPYSSFAGSNYQFYLQRMGRYDEALAFSKPRLQRDPLSADLNAATPFILLSAGRYDEALSGFQKVREEFPLYLYATIHIGAAYASKGMYEKAIPELEKVISLTKTPERGPFSLLALCYAKTGRKERAREMLRELEELSKQRKVDPIFFAIIHSGLSENNEAFQFLEKAFPDRPAPPYLHVMPPLRDVSLNVLRMDSRWPAFARRKGLAR